jgi:hypothetical protein
MSKNDITGDDIKTKPSTKAYEEGWERIFASQRKMEEEYNKKFKRPPQSLDAAYERKAMMEGLVVNPLFPENKELK